MPARIVYSFIFLYFHYHFMSGAITIHIVGYHTQTTRLHYRRFAKPRVNTIAFLQGNFVVNDVDEDAVLLLRHANDTQRLRIQCFSAKKSKIKGKKEVS